MGNKIEMIYQTNVVIF